MRLHILGPSMLLWTVSRHLREGSWESLSNLLGRQRFCFVLKMRGFAAGFDFWTGSSGTSRKFHWCWVFGLQKLLVPLLIFPRCLSGWIWWTFQGIFTRKRLSFLARTSSRFIKLHSNTERCIRMDLAKVLVEVDLTKHFPNKISLRGRDGSDVLVYINYIMG